MYERVCGSNCMRTRNLSHERLAALPLPERKGWNRSSGDRFYPPAEPEQTDTWMEIGQTTA